MVLKATLFNESGDKVLFFQHVGIDICKSMTLICRKFETVRLPLAPAVIQVTDRKITVMYENDYCLTIIPY